MKKRYLMQEANEQAFSLITDIENSDESVYDLEIESNQTLPVLPLRNMVLFPGVFMPVSVGRTSSLKLIREANKKNGKSKLMVLAKAKAELELS